jgi:vacuolar-type H+-ATPase subunit E/Vma4
MATATRTPPRAAKPAATRAKTPDPGTLDFLQRALEDLNRAREHAQQDAQAGIDDATERIRAAADDVRRRLREEADELQKRLDRASEEARVELGRVAIRAQRTPEALNELAREIRHGKDSLKDDGA